VPDNCEDRYAPTLAVRDALLFRGVANDTARLWHNAEVFNNEDSAKNFLGYQFGGIVDDCQPSANLDLIIERTGGSCSETQYIVTPLQAIPACNSHNSSGPPFNIPFDNPLRGDPLMVTLQLDDEPPVIRCGFLLDSAPGINVVSPDGTTLYHYMMKLADNSEFRLNEARFWYDARVRVIVCELETYPLSCFETHVLTLHPSSCTYLVTARTTAKPMFELI
jgi:hypothetical protein